MNSYPFLDSKSRPPFTTNLSEITPAVRKERIIDITSSSLVPASDLRSKLEYLHICGEIDGGLPLVRRGVLVGLLPAPDLEFALDKLQNEQCLCIMSTQSRWTGLEDSFDSQPELADFTPYIDPVSMII